MLAQRTPPRPGDSRVAKKVVAYCRSKRPITAGPRFSWKVATESRRTILPSRFAQPNLGQVAGLGNSPRPLPGCRNAGRPRSRYTWRYRRRRSAC